MSTNVREYIGSRYVPIFGRKNESTIQWDNTKPYEPLTIVLYEGNSYTSRQYVPIGIEITNQTYWALTGNFNAQVEQYRERMESLEAALPIGSFSGENTVKDYIDNSFVHTFDNVAAMKSADLEIGDICHTNGFYLPEDGGAAWYEIKSSGTANEMDIIECGDYNAHLINNNPYITPEILGSKGNGTNNDTSVFNRMLEIVASSHSVIENEITAMEMHLGHKTYLIDTINIPTNMAIVKFIGNGSRIKTGGFHFGSDTGWKVLFKNITFENCANPIDMDERNLEYGKYEIESCIFHNCTGVCINIERRSCQTIINNCVFRAVEKSAYIKDSDMFIFSNNWLECSSAWSDNHCDVEHYCPIEGQAEIFNNMFIPGYSQTANLPVWVKVGRHANIHGNRFSGENTTIHPIYVNYDNVSSYNWNTTVYPLVNIYDNMITGNPRILVGNCRGRINIHNNTGWVNGMGLLKLTDPTTLEPIYADISTQSFTINIKDNTGRLFAFAKNGYSNISASYKPTIPASLEKFVVDTMYAGNYNDPIEIAYNSSTYTTTIKTSFENFNNYYSRAYICNGNCNKNPSGGGYYQDLVFIVAVHKYLESSEWRYKAVANIISSNEEAVTIKATLNGQDYLTAVPSGEKLEINLVGSGNMRLSVKNVQSLQDIMKPRENGFTN